jgi:hypothetical protein
MVSRSITDLKAEIAKELNAEYNDKAKAALKRKMRDLQNAKAIVQNIEREIADLEISIADGSFTG